MWWLEPVSAFLTDRSMAQNLISELVGIVVTLIFVSWLGGAFVRRSLNRAFLRKWGEYRTYIAETLASVDDRLSDGLAELELGHAGRGDEAARGGEDDDLDEYRRAYNSVTGDIDLLVNFMHRHHFALTDEDIGPISDYIAFVNADMQSIFREDVSFRSFESLLLTHFQGRYPLSAQLFAEAGATRHAHLRASAEAAAAKLTAVDRRAWRARREAVLASLRPDAGGRRR